MGETLKAEQLTAPSPRPIPPDGHQNPFDSFIPIEAISSGVPISSPNLSLTIDVPPSPPQQDRNGYARLYETNGTKKKNAIPRAAEVSPQRITRFSEDPTVNSEALAVIAKYNDAFTTDEMSVFKRLVKGTATESNLQPNESRNIWPTLDSYTSNIRLRETIDQINRKLKEQDIPVAARPRERDNQNPPGYAFVRIEPETQRKKNEHREESVKDLKGPTPRAAEKQKNTTSFTLPEVHLLTGFLVNAHEMEEAGAVRPPKEMMKSIRELIKDSPPPKDFKVDKARIELFAKMAKMGPDVLNSAIDVLPSEARAVFDHIFSDLASTQKAIRLYVLRDELRRQAISPSRELKPQEF